MWILLLAQTGSLLAIPRPPRTLTNLFNCVLKLKPPKEGIKREYHDGQRAWAGRAQLTAL